MPLFSQRAGVRPLTKAIQRESIDQDLRNALWTSFHEIFVKAYYEEEGRSPIPYYPYRSEINGWLHLLWTIFYKAPSDTKPKFREAIDRIRVNFFEAEWHWVFDFLEFSAKSAQMWTTVNQIREHPT